MRPKGQARLVGWFLGALLATFPVFGQVGEKVASELDLTTALEVAVSEEKPVVIYFTMPNCAPCRIFETETLPDREVREALEKFVFLKIDITENPRAAQRFGVRGTPSHVVLDSSGKERSRAQGALAKRAYLTFLGEGMRGDGLPGGESSGISWERLKNGVPTDLAGEDFFAVLELSGDGEVGKKIRQAFRQTRPFPKERLVGALEHERLRIRLAALEILEDQTGRDWGFDPWRPEEWESQEGLAQWKKWAGDSVEAGEAVVEAKTLEDFVGLLNDLIGEDTARSRRAARTLGEGGKSALEALRHFQELNPNLLAGARMRLRECHWAILLETGGARDASALARRLVHGNLDVQILGMKEVVRFGKNGETIVREFLKSPEPLLREAAIEILMERDASGTVPVVAQILEQERDANVTFVILRLLGKAPLPQASPILKKYTSHESEDLAVAALEGLGRLKDGTAVAEVGQALDDPRWRVRVAALKAASSASMQSLARKISERVGDSDEFVRITAVETMASMKFPGAQKQLEEAFLTDAALRPAVVKAFAGMSLPLSPKMLETIRQADVGSLLAVAGSIQDVDEKTIPLLSFLAAHEDADVACMALRLLAANGGGEPAALRSIAGALKAGESRRLNAILASLELDHRFVWANRPETGIFDFGLAGAPVKNGPSEYDMPKKDPEVLNQVEEACLKIIREGDDEMRVDAAIVLVGLGRDEGLDLVREKWKQLSTSQRERLARQLVMKRTAAALPVFRDLLHDEDGGVRQVALDSLMRGKVNESALEVILQELVRPAGRLTAMEAQSYALNRLLTEGGVPGAAPRLARVYAESPDEQIRLFALFGLGRAWDAKIGREVMLKAVRSESPFERRAAFYALGRNDPETLEQMAESVVTDDSEWVREVYPVLKVPESVSWSERYSAEDVRRDYWYSRNYGDAVKPLPADVLERLGRLKNDPSAQVRVMTWQALLGHKINDVIPEFVAFAMDHPNQKEIRNLVTELLNDRQTKLSAQHAPLLVFYDDSRSPDRARMVRLELSAYAARAEKEAKGSDSESEEVPAASVTAQIPAVEKEKSSGVPADLTQVEPVEILYFNKPGCSHCDQVAGMLARVREAFPEMTVRTLNINKNDSMRLNEALAARFAVAENLRLVAPSLFGTGGYLIKDDISEERIAQLIFRTRAVGGGSLAEVGEGELDAAGGAIEQRFEAIQVGVILAAGLLDGVNPCAFATIIFLLSYLQIARKSSREIAQIGVAYIAGVFTAYFVLGLGLVEIVTRVTALKWAGQILNIGMGIFALVVAFFSFRDGFRCLRGELAEMTLQLPGFLKERIHLVIRSTVRHRYFVLMAFGVGALISVLELACTGQVYLPTILYMLKNGQESAIGYLAVYNLAFVFPLSVVFGLAYFGMTSERLVGILKKNAAWVKFGLGLLFLTLGVFLILGKLS
jgi:HEAT repeat protein/thiol-disulfide isomerase/thioredoxin